MEHLVFGILGTYTSVSLQVDSFVTSSQTDPHRSLNLLNGDKCKGRTHTPIKTSAGSSSGLQERQLSRLIDVLPSSLFHCVAQLAGCVVMISEPLFTVIPVLQITLHIKKTYVICEGISSLRLQSSWISWCHSPIHLSYLESKFCSSVSFHKFRKRILVAFDGLTALCMMRTSSTLLECAWFSLLYCLLL